MIENIYFTFFVVLGMVSLWLPMLFFARGAATDFLRGLAMKSGHGASRAKVLIQNHWVRELVASRWSRGAYATLKCLCFCSLGLELALTRGPVAVLGSLTIDQHTAIRTGAQLLAWTTAGFCLVRGLPILLEDWTYFREKLPGQPPKHHPEGNAA
jgi:phosphatidylglycerophosphate synthase